MNPPGARSDPVLHNSQDSEKEQLWNTLHTSMAHVIRVVVQRQ